MNQNRVVYEVLNFITRFERYKISKPLEIDFD